MGIRFHLFLLIWSEGWLAAHGKKVSVLFSLPDHSLTLRCLWTSQETWNSLSKTLFDAVCPNICNIWKLTRIMNWAKLHLRKGTLNQVTAGQKNNQQERSRKITMCFCFELIIASFLPLFFSSHPGQDASPSQGYPPAVCHWYPLIHLGEERQNGVKFLV